ncbi:MAG: ATP-binding protein [Planctomycetota bacterium]
MIRQILVEICNRLGVVPISLAGKCRIAFGGALLFILALALAVPYFWMGKLIEKASLDAGRAVASTVYEEHFQFERDASKGLPKLRETGTVQGPNEPSVQWIRFSQKEQEPAWLDEKRKKIIKDLKSADESLEFSWFESDKGIEKSNYIRIVRATDTCMSCHNPQGSAGAFSLGKEIGAIIIETPAREINKTLFMNRIWVIFAGLLAGTGAIVTFYLIVQRVILRPVRQLRGLANNVAEGNLDIRSSIKTRDEFESFAFAFNNMLDALQNSQEKLRRANKQLDAKIAELSDRNIELFKANKLKSEFLANMSHEFRTPLNAILGFAEILREKKMNDAEKAARYAENIITSGRSLLNMINDLLELAKTEAGRIEIHLEKTSIQELCRAVLGFFAPMLEKKKIKVKTILDENVPLVQTDPGKVQQILYNLLSNATKFTPQKGRIQIKAYMPDEKTVRIAITDSGPGIDLADQEKIFDKFRQLDGSITRQSTGTGLGLAICKELACLLAGGIGMESEPGKGATFWLDIPAALAKADQDA